MGEKNKIQNHKKPSEKSFKEEEVTSLNFYSKVTNMDKKKQNTKNTEYRMCNLAQTPKILNTECVILANCLSLITLNMYSIKARLSKIVSI